MAPAKLRLSASSTKSPHPTRAKFILMAKSSTSRTSGASAICPRSAAFIKNGDRRADDLPGQAKRAESRRGDQAAQNMVRKTGYANLVEDEDRRTVEGYAAKSPVCSHCVARARPDYFR